MDVAVGWFYTRQVSHCSAQGQSARLDARRPELPRIRPMSSTVDALILDLLEWIAAEPRSYDEVMEAWRTSCPRLPVWEDASDRGFVVRERSDGRGVRVLLTPAGRKFLAESGRKGRTAGISTATAGREARS